MSIPQPSIRWIGCHPNNFSSGRQGRSVNAIVFHHIVGPLSSADATFQNPNRIASATFGVGSSEIHQYVSLSDTAYANGNWESNLSSVSIEHEGDWRFGYRNDAVIENSARLVAWLRTVYPNAVPHRHRDVSDQPTQCCADLPVEEIWNRATDIINAAQTPEWLKNRTPLTGTYYAQVDGLRIWDLNNPSQPADARVFARNTDFQIASKTTVGGQEFYITKSSTDINKANGIKASELSQTPWQPPVVTPPAPEVREWERNLQDVPNKRMWVTTNTVLVDLVTGTPVYNKDTEVRFTAGQAIDDVSATTTVAGKTYALTEYSFSKHIGRGIELANLSVTDPTLPAPVDPPPTTPPTEPEYPLWFIRVWRKLVEAIKSIIPGIN